MYQALYRKWRPRTFDDVVGQSHITDTLKRQVAEGRLSHAYLFTGTRGTGKTSCAKILARAVNCEHPVDGSPCNACPSCQGIENGSILDVLELDAASNNGVDQVRALRDEAVYSPAAVRKRVYIVDEVHMLSTAAFNALLKILEEPPEHLMFILATTELHKVPATIKSRCQQFAFKRITPIDITQRLKFVAGEESIPLTADGATLLARLADGGMRDALSLLDQCATGADTAQLGEKEILDALGLAGNVETAALMGEIAQNDAGAALTRMSRLYAGGKDVGSLLNELAGLARDLLIRATAPKGGAGLLNGGYDEATLRSLGQQLSVSRLAQILGQLQQTGADLARSANRQVDAELCLIRLCDETLDDSAAGLNARLARLEELVAQLMAGGAKPAAKTVPQPAAPVKKETAPPSPAAEDAPPFEMADPDVPPPWVGGAEEPEDTPPWDMAPPPASEDMTSMDDGGSAAQAEAAQQPQSAPEEQGEVPPVSEPAPVGNFWPGMVAGLKGKIPMGEYSFLSDPGTAQGVLDGNVLKVWVKDEFTKKMLDKPGVLAAIQRAAALLPTPPGRVALMVGQAPAVAPTPAAGDDHDKMDDLLALGRQFGDIFKEQ